MEKRQSGESRVFVVTIRLNDSSSDLHGSVSTVAAAGSAGETRRWFRNLDQLPALIRGLLARLR